MQVGRLLSGSATLFAACVMAVASTAAAQERPLFEWYGRVDREVQVVMRGSHLSTHFVGNNESVGERRRIAGALPRVDGRVRVFVQHGRGAADVIQQPMAGNDYTAIVRIRDDRSGADDYRLSAIWEPTANGGWDGGYGDPRYDPRDRSRDRGTWERDRDDDDWGRDRNRGRGRDNDRWGRRDSGVLRWSGGVDDVVEIRIQGRRADYVSLSGKGTRSVRSEIFGDGLSRRSTAISVRQREGRGSVTVVQQPSAHNGYTAIIRIHDSRGGFGYYDFEAAW